MKKKQTQKQKQKQSVRQSTNVKVIVGNSRRRSRSRSSKPRSSTGYGYQSSPNIISITNPSAVPTNYQLPIFNEYVKPQQSPFLSNTPAYANVQQPLGLPNINNEIPVINKKVPIDPTPASGAVPASFIPSEAPELVKAGGQIENVLDLTEEYSFQKGLNTLGKQVRGREGVLDFFDLPIEVEATPVKPRKKYEFKPETLERRKTRKEQEQNVSPLKATIEPIFMNPLDVEPTKSILDSLAKDVSESQEGQKQLINLMKQQEAKPVKKAKELSMTPSAIYQRERRARLNQSK
jgi:hypothetical protein